MEEDTIQEIRDLRNEVRSYRDELSQWREETLSRIVTVEAQIKPAILGNGSPSRLAAVEGRVRDLEKQWWTLAGGTAVVGTVAACAYEVFKSFILPALR